MKTRLCKTLLLGLVITALISAFGMDGFADSSVEYSRITIGGGHSAKGKFSVNASMTQSTGSAVQTGGSFTVTNIKGKSEESAVGNWKEY